MNPCLVGATKIAKRRRSRTRTKTFIDKNMGQHARVCVESRVKTLAR